MGMNRVIVAIVLALSACAHAMPSEQELNKVKPIVDSLIADDMRALKAKKKSKCSRNIPM